MSKGKLNLCQAWWPKGLALKHGHQFPEPIHKRSFSIIWRNALPSFCKMLLILFECDIAI